MNYKEYESKAITTRVYDPAVAIPYVALGLTGEMGELYEKIQNGASVEETSKEAGDVLWYLAAIRVELNLKEVTEWPVTNNIEPDPFVLVVNAGKIAEQCKKYLRDDWKPGCCTFPEKRKEVVEESWNEILYALTYLAGSKFFNEKGIEVIAKENNEKLASRAKRNEIHGSGDNR
jgi:hypothetical protein